MAHRQSLFLALGLVQLSFLGFSNTAFGWGSYGHEQINSAAIELLEGTPLGKCFVKNRELIVRLAVTPDYDWKMIGKAPADDTLRHLKAQHDRLEKPMHYFEADAFLAPSNATPAAIAALPSDADYEKVIDQYIDLRSKNLATIAKIDPKKGRPITATNKATLRRLNVAAVKAHGTAPWRIVQLYDLAVESLTNEDYEMAFMALGALGHYAGDMSQPFHATLNYDGAFYEPSASNIHSVFEEKILEAAAAEAGTDQDRDTHLWANFDATNEEVLDTAKPLFAKTKIERGSIIPQILELVGSGYPTISHLLGAFTFANIGTLGNFPAANTVSAHAIAPLDDSSDPDDHLSTVTSHQAATHERKHTTPKTAIRAFKSLDYINPKSTHPKTTVLQLANQRMAGSSALLAAIWSRAVEDASAANPKLKKIGNCDVIEFSEQFVIEKYPLPKSTL